MQTGSHSPADARRFGTIGPLVAVFLAWATWHCATTAESDGDANPVVIQTGTSEVALDEYLFFCQKNYPEITDFEDPELHSHIFDQFKRDLLIAQISQVLGFRITGEQVENFIRYKMTGMSIHLLPPAEQTLWRKEITRRLAIQQFLEREILGDVSISDEAITRYYDTHQDQFKKEALYSLRFVQTATEDQAKAMLMALKKSQDPFVKVAAAYSENEGHQLVIPMPLSELLPPFRKAVERLKPGRHSKLIPVKQGETLSYYVLYLESIIPAAQIPYEEAYHHIRQQLEKERCQGLLEEKIEQFQHRIPAKVFWQNLPFTYIAASQRKEV